MLPNVLPKSGSEPHVPVLADEVRELLAVQPGDTVVDATFGAGGHARLLAEDLKGTGKLVAIDRAQVLLPGGAVPDLEVVIDARDDDVPAEAGMPCEGWWDEDASVPVELGIGGTREEEAPQLAGLPRERVESGEPCLDCLAPGVARVDRDVAVQPFRQDHAGCQALAKTGREREPALVVDGVLVLAEEQGLLLRASPTSPHFRPLSPTLQERPATDPRFEGHVAEMWSIAG